MYLDIFGKFLVIYVQKYFLTLVRNFGPKNHPTFWLFLKNTIFSQKSDDLHIILVKFNF